jgi:hypothetical protein
MVIYRLSEGKEKEYLEKLSSNPILADLCPYLEDKYGKGRYFLSSWVDETGKKTDRKINTLDYTKNFRTNKKKNTAIAVQGDSMEDGKFNLKDLMGLMTSGKGDVGEILKHVMPIIQSISEIKSTLDKIVEGQKALNEKISQLEESLFEEEAAGEAVPEKSGMDITGLLGLLGNIPPEDLAKLKAVLGMFGQNGNQSFNLQDIINSAQTNGKGA